jgi:hypothetical protein
MTSSEYPEITKPEAPTQRHNGQHEHKWTKNRKLTVAILAVCIVAFVVTAAFEDSLLESRMTRFLVKLFCHEESIRDSCAVVVRRFLKYGLECIMQISEFGAVVVVSHLIYENVLKNEELELYDERLRDISDQFQVRLVNAGERTNQKVNDSISEISKTVAADRRLSGYGLIKIYDGFGIDSIRDIVIHLKRGSTLYWHTTFIPDFKKIIGGDDIIIQMARNGVKFRFLMLEPFCSNANWRAKESSFKKDAPVSYRRAKVNDYMEELRSYQASLQSLVDELSGEPDYRHNIQYKLYRSPPSIPFILIEEEEGEQGSIDRCFAGYYLNMKPSDSFYLEWKAPQLLDPKNYGFPQELKKYWDTKWTSLSKDHEQVNPFKGKWWYLIYSHTDSLQDTPLASGSVEVTEDIITGELALKGKRLYQRGNDDSGRANILWESDRIKISIDPYEEGRINLSIRYHLNLRDSLPNEPQGDMDIVYVSFDKVMSGSFNIWGELKMNPHQDVPLRSGTIKFTRAEAVYDSMIRNSI